MTLTRVGSDHCPLLLDDETRNDQIRRGFRFEIAWLSQNEFRRKLTEKWLARRGEIIQDFWKRLKKELRQLSKGMRANLDREIKRRTAKVLRDIKWLDDKTEAMELDEDGWRLRYELERELEEIYTYKESI
jgi:polyhydroxyalkanoate synthesis regulator phasin